LNATDDTAIARPQMRRVRRLVVKVGSNVLTTRQHKPNRPVIRQLVKDIVELRSRGVEVAIVTSGAVAAGMGRLNLTQRPEQIAELQALAAIGQNLMMNSYKTLFRRHNVPVGQVLLTAEDILDNRRRYLNLENTFRSLFAYGAVPVINENDSVAVAELRRKLGENDMLAAYVSNLIRADLLVIMSDVEGLYTAFGPNGPEGELLREVRDSDSLETMAGGSYSGIGSGGMITKLRAARLLMTCGEMTLIAHGRKHRLLNIMDGQPLGTLFLPEGKRLGSRKRWIAFASQCRGRVVVDGGAQRAMAEQYRSLLPAGIVACEGDFAAGDVISIDNEGSEELGRGLSRYSSEELRRILGKSSPAVAKELGRPALEVIHRDDLVLF
jgi:glutamate 5-kinase